jgi:TonB-dependent receptor
MNSSLLSCLLRPVARAVATLLFVGFVPALLAAAQGAAPGSLGGRVVQTATRKVLESAVVSVVGSSLTTVTDARGEFFIPNLPPGDYTVRVSYTGLDAAEQSARVTAGRKSEVVVGMTSGIYVMGQFVVAGEREGAAKAIQDQREAPNLASIITADQFGGVADGAIDDALKRLPGLTFQNGDFAIRGIPNQLNAVEINGVRVAAAAGTSDDPLGEERGAKTDRIPGDLIEKIEVTKSSTPNRSADAIGGTINLVTKSAFTSRGRRVNGLAGFSQVTGLVNAARLSKTFNASYSDVVGVFGKKENLGVFVSASYSDIDVQIDRPFRANEQLSTFNTNDPTSPTLLTGVRLSYDVESRLRKNAGFKLDYKLGEQSVVTFDTAFNHDEKRQRSERARLFASTRSVGGVTINNILVEEGGRFIDNTLATKVADRMIYTGVATSLENLNDLFKTDGRRFGLRGDHRWSDWQLIWNGSYSNEKTKLREGSPESGGTLRLDAVRTTDFLVDRTDRLYPSFSVYGGAAPILLDITNVRSGPTQSQLRQRDRDNESTLASGAVDLKRNLGVFNNTYVQAGGLWRGEKRTNNDSATRNYAFLGSDYSRFTGPSANPFNRYQNKYGADSRSATADRTADPAKWALINTADSLTQSDAANDGSVEENIYAGYAMAYTEFGPLGALAGRRQEYTYDDSEGTATDNRLPIPQRYTGRARRSGDYENGFNYLHLRYRVKPNLQARFSYSEGIGRPSFGTLRAKTDYNLASLRITQNNPDLRPQFTANYDATLEWYFKPAGTLSFGVFRKNMRDYIVSTTEVLGANGGPFGSDYAGWTWSHSANGGSARLEGYEFNYAQQFTFLPGFMRSLGAFANFTHINSQATFTGAVQQMANVIPNAANAGFSYLRSPISLRLLGYYRDAFALQYDANTYTRVSRESSLEWDAKLSYKVWKGISVYCDIYNILEEEPLNFAGRVGDMDRIVYVNRRPRRFDFGVRANW